MCKSMKNLSFSVVIMVGFTFVNCDQISRTPQLSPLGRIYQQPPFQVPSQNILLGPRMFFCTEYCDSFLGYPTEQVEKIVQNFNVSKEFFIKDEEPVDLADRADPKERTLCRSVMRTVYPTMGKNKHNEWKLIVNHPTKEGYIQSVRIEVCARNDVPCDFVEILGYQTTCKQKYMYRRLVSINGRGRPEIDMIRLPSGCECTYKPVSYKTSRTGRIIPDRSPFGNRMFPSG